MDFRFASAGFSNIDNLKDDIIQQAIKSWEYSKTKNDYSSNTLIETKKMFSENLGIIIRGNLDKNKILNINAFDPYISTDRITKLKNTKVKQVPVLADVQIYNCVFIEKQTGIWLNFYIQNIIELIKRNSKIRIKEAKIVALATQGTIILPLDTESMIIELDEYKEMLEELEYDELDEGDEQLEYDQLDIEEKYNLMIEEIKGIDIYSIVETSLVCIDEEMCIYYLLGIINKVKKIKNKYTKENVYMMSVDVMGMVLDVCINEKNLEGIPTVGMRITTTCWLQGEIV